MEPSKIVVNAKTIREAQDTVEAQMALRGERISTIMAKTGKSYARVMQILELAGLTS